MRRVRDGPICCNPDAAVRDAAVRQDLIAKPGETIAGSAKLSATKGAELRGKISMLPDLNRFLRVIPGRLLIQPSVVVCSSGVHVRFGGVSPAPVSFVPRQ